MKDETLVKKEISRLQKIFQDIPDNKRAAVEGLIERAAFMRVTLQRLEGSIYDSDLVEEWRNGQQGCLKQAATLQAFNSLMKNYATVIKQLTSLIPNRLERKAPQNALMELLNAKRAEDAKQKTE